MDTNRVEARFADGTTLAIDCTAIEDEYGNTPADWKNDARRKRAAKPHCGFAYGTAHRRPVHVPSIVQTKKKNQNTNVFWFFLVRWKGLEPPAY